MRRDTYIFGVISLLALTFAPEASARDGAQLCSLPQRHGAAPAVRATIPELDPSAGASALALLIGGTIALTTRRRQQPHA